MGIFTNRLGDTRYYQMQVIRSWTSIKLGNLTWFMFIYVYIMGIKVDWYINKLGSTKKTGPCHGVSISSGMCAPIKAEVNPSKLSEHLRALLSTINLHTVPNIYIYIIHLYDTHIYIYIYYPISIIYIYIYEWLLLQNDQSQHTRNGPEHEQSPHCGSSRSFEAYPPGMKHWS